MLGGVSFAAYLVHWPLFLLLDEDRLGFGGPLLFLVPVAATLAAAAAVTYGLERPLRTGSGSAVPASPWRSCWSLVVVGAAAFVLPQQPPPASASPSTTETVRATSTSSSRPATRPCRSPSSAARWPAR